MSEGLLNLFEPARPIRRALGLTAGDLLFFDVKQNTINKTALRTVKINLYKNGQQLANTNHVYEALAVLKNFYS